MVSMSDELDGVQASLDHQAGGSHEHDQMHAVVTGLIHPTKLGWMFEQPTKFQLDQVRCELFIRHSQFNVFAEGDRPIDERTFLNSVGTIVQACLDSLGFFLATPLRAEILSMVIDSNQLIHLEGRWQELIPERTENYARADKLAPFVHAAINEPLVRLALADLRAAIDSPGDTVMLSYRAIESIRQWFLPEGIADNGAPRRRSWADMKAALDVEETEIRSLETLATARRHGADAIESADQRLNALRTARRIVEQFVARRHSLTIPPAEPSA